MYWERLSWTFWIIVLMAPIVGKDPLSTENNLFYALMIGHLINEFVSPNVLDS